MARLHNTLEIFTTGNVLGLQIGWCWPCQGFVWSKKVIVPVLLLLHASGMIWWYTLECLLMLKVSKPHWRHFFFLSHLDQCSFIHLSVFLSVCYYFIVLFCHIVQALWSLHVFKCALEINVPCLVFVLVLTFACNGCVISDPLLFFFFPSKRMSCNWHNSVLVEYKKAIALHMCQTHPSVHIHGRVYF